MNLEPILNAHAYMRVERPPELWGVDVVDDAALIRVLGEQIVIGLLHGNELGDLTLNASNMAIEASASSATLPEGEYVALTVLGHGEWSPEIVWPREAEMDVGDYANLVGALERSEAAFAYSRTLRTGGSITVAYRRLGSRD